jgi:flagellar basal-body rod protein FlgF
MVNPGGELGSSISSLTSQFNVISHNLANINTAGYKRTVNSFSKTLMDQFSDGPDELLSPGKVNIDSVLDFSQGSFLKTDRSLDVAINGKGFFVVETPDGPLYTRNGMFHINSQNQLTDLDGRIVSGQSGPIVVPSGISVQQVDIAEDGNVSSGGSALGRLKIVDFGEDEARLFSAGKNCFGAPEDVQGGTAEKALVTQGYQENSNVNRMEELVDLITVSRLYETNMKLLVRRRENARAIIDVAKG